jgi:RHS repeat-associated protein
MSGRRWLVVLGAVAVLSGSVVVPPLAEPASAVPAGVDDDVSVVAAQVPVLAEEPSVAEESTAVTSPAVAAVWPGPASAVLDVPVAAGRAAPGEAAPSAAVAGVAVLADGGAAAAVRPGSGLEPQRGGPGLVPPDAPELVGGLAAGGLSRVRVTAHSRELAQALGAAQVFTVRAADGSAMESAVDLRVDYSPYAEAFGGNYADRLRLVRLPACAVGSPSSPGCWVPEPVLAVNDPVSRTLIARVPVPGEPGSLDPSPQASGSPESGTVLAVTSTTQGTSTGDYTATDLNPGGTWQVGLSSGSFGYGYPMPEPPSQAGSGLGLALSYDSQSVDAFTQSTNNQSGWAGLGWDLSPGFIERKFRPCSQDVGDGSPKERADQVTWGDLCWESPDQNDGESDTTDFSTSELYLSLNGVSTRIVKDHVSGEWKTEQDFGWELELLSGAPGGEYWQISTLDGDRYRFGYTNPANNRVPVVGDDPGEPNYDNYPGVSQQTWRWNLDQVIDADENNTALVWTEESNYYKRVVSGSIVTYARGAYLDRIEYGYNHTVPGSIPTAKVEFTSIGRCVEATVRDDPVAQPYVSTDCPPATEANAASYPDVPVDLKCSSTSCSHLTPTFFSEKRLEHITTYQWDPVAQDFRNIYRLHLRFKTLNPPGLTGQVLWLDRIFPVGLVGLDVDKQRLPGVNFDVEYLQGRVDHAEAEHGVSAMNLPRVFRVYNGYGGRTDVTYGHVAPCPTSGSATGNDEYWDWYAAKAGKWDLNTEECAPVWYKPEGAPAGWGIFHKYLAMKVVDTDLVGGSPPMVTSYEYRGKAAWALGYGFMDSQGLTESWNEWRGYPTVRVHTGSGTDPDGYSMSEHTYFRGLYYDFLSDWQTQRHTQVTNYDGGVYSDFPGRAGKPLQVRHYQTTGYHSDPALRSFTEVASSRFSYTWTGSGDGPGWRNPRMAHRWYQRHRVALDGGGWREQSEELTLDAFGLPTRILDNGQVGVSGDSTCTSISYARRDEGNWYLIDYPETVQTHASGTCGSGALLSRSVTFYDGATAVGSQSPFDGNPTQVRTYTSGTAFLTTGSSYDDYGRVTSTTDPAGQTTTVVYNPAVNWPEAGITTTNPAGHVSAVQLSRNTGVPHRVVDPNGKVTEIAFDRLGRPVEVFLPTEPVSAGIPSLRFDYTVTWDGGIGQPTAATRVASHTLASKAGGGQYLSSYVLDDGFGRVREAQAASPAGGRVVSATYYDPRGLASIGSATFHNTGSPGSGLVNAAPTSLPSWTRSEFDSLGQETVVAAMTGTGELWRTTIEYSGDHVTTTPPAGAAPVTIWSDVRGNTTLRQEHLTGGATVDTAYQHDLVSQLTGVVDDAGNHWSYSYDLAGRRTQAVDPDTGTTTYTYDSAGRLAATTDGRGQMISTAYDVLGRPVSRWAGPVGTSKLAEWVHDTVALGQPTSATRWHGGQAYVTRVDGYNDRYQPTGRTVSVPSGEGALAGDYTYGYTYTDAGWGQSVTLPAAGGLPAETVATTYTPLGLADTTSSDFGGGTTYIAASSYDKTGDLVQLLLGETGFQVARDLAWDEATGRLDGITTVAGADTTTPATVQDDAYSYDPAGNVTSIVDHTVGPAGQAQCFSYDDLRRLVQAWTTTSAACGDGPSAGVVDGPDPYWHSWSFDTVGNRLTQVEHAVGGGEQVSTSYSYPAPGQPNPHAVSGRSVTDSAGTVVTGYGYGPAGHTISRPTEGGQQQTLTWDAEGHLAGVTDESGAAGYVYDVDGDRLVAHNPDGSAVLYLPGGVEVHADPAGITSCVRYYGDVAVRTTAGGLTWLAADRHGTGSVAIDAESLAATKRRTSPYGELRGPVTGGAWPDDKGFLGKPVDPSGLTHIGAREYDPGLGRFISVDPIMNLADPQQMHGYAYANNNPVTWSDPTGLLCTPDGYSFCPGQDIRKQPVIKKKSPPKPRIRPGGGGWNCVDYCGSRADNKVRKHVGLPSRGKGGTTGRVEPGARGVTHDDLASASYGKGYIELDSAQRKHVEEAVFARNNPGAYTAYVDSLRVDFGANDQYGLGNELAGSADAHRCFANGDAGGCVWVALGFTPVKLLKLGKLFKTAGKFCSFSGDTPVLMADGSTKPIAELEPGDQVLATNPETGERSAQTVTAIWIHQDTVIELELDNQATIATTADHPFWNHTDQQWQPASTLAPGDHLLTPDDSAVTVVGPLDSLRPEQTTYNLTVANTHTYHVLANDAPVLVHNCGNSLDEVLATQHGRNRLAERGFDSVDIVLTRGSATAYEQLDGAVAHVAQVGDNSFNVIVTGGGGVVTGMKGLTRRQVNSLARNYDWTGYP